MPAFLVFFVSQSNTFLYAWGIFLLERILIIAFPTLSLLALYQKNTIIPNIRYGIIKRYKIPVFKPAENCSLFLLMLFSIDALHMEHCAMAVIWDTAIKAQIKRIYLIFRIISLIVRPDHKIYCNSGE
jgi:hypothetical protein